MPGVPVGSDELRYQHNPALIAKQLHASLVKQREAD